jgi:hypothetical protein
MCFSAPASFIAGATLSAIGVATLRRAETKSEVPFAAIPLLFGVQQLTEGVIWLTFQHDAPLLRQTMTYVYSGFSHVLWPIYVPFAMGFMETERWRKRTIAAFQAAGLVAGLYLLYSIVARPIVAEADRHIVYVTPHFYLPAVIALYLAATCVTCFFSSHAFVKLFGILALLAFAVAYIFAAHALVSVWCFFAAILSVLIYLHLRYRSLGGFPAPAPSTPGEQHAAT